jgi:hypothetical protein
LASRAPDLKEKHPNRVNDEAVVEVGKEERAEKRNAVQEAEVGRPVQEVQEKDKNGNVFVTLFSRDLSFCFDRQNQT